MLFVVVAHAVERRTVVGSEINRRGIIDARVVALVVACVGVEADRSNGRVVI